MSGHASSACPLFLFLKWREDMNKELLTVEEAAEYTRTPIATLRWYRATGRGPKSIRPGRRVLYKVADLQAWLDSGE